MQIVIATYGTTGDVQPLLGLASGLMEQGHTISFAAPPNFRSRVEGLGIKFIPLGQEVDEAKLREAYGMAFQIADCVTHVERTLPLVVRDAPQMVEELHAACRNADLLISLPYQLAGRIVHDLTGIPFVSIHLSPFAGYSKRFSAATAAPINKLRSCYGLLPLTDPLGIDGSSSTLALHAVSTEIIRRPKHWPIHFVMSGFLFLNEQWTPDANLQEFLSAGDPPVVVSFGSVMHTSPNEVAGVVFDVIRRSGRRAVVQRGWSGLSSAEQSDNIHFAGFVPHHWLFPRAGCVIHAGGAGTTAAALRAGAPSVIVPHWLDQFLWGQFMLERRYASAVIPFAELNSRDLLAAVQGCYEPEIKVSVSEVATKIQAETGVANAVRHITSAMERSAAAC